ncbi:MAG TPA: hypothetical protein VFE14_08525 [Micromonosporaceae bacterium]|nr:hypothetical protein [Micromonosporaceae bacterium]
MVYEPAPAQPTRSRSTTRIVLIVVGSVLAVCCLCGIAGGIYLYNTYNNSAGPARAATRAYLDDVLAGNYSGAYGQLCARTRATTSEAEYTRIQRAQVKITKYDLVGVTIGNYNGRTGATVTARLTQDTGAEFTQTFPLVKENGDWRVCT